jgi:hypothetical protein
MHRRSDCTGHSREKWGAHHISGASVRCFAIVISRLILLVLSAQADFIFTCGTVSACFVCDIVDDSTLMRRAEEATGAFKHAYVISNRGGRAGQLESLMSGAVRNVVTLELTESNPRQMFQFMATTMRSLTAVMQGPQQNAPVTAAELPDECSIVESLASLLSACSTQTDTPVITAAARASAHGLLQAAGGSLSDVMSTLPQDVVDAVGLDAAAAQRFGQTVHTAGPAALALAWQ